MPTQSHRKPPIGNYANAAKNLRNFAEGSNILPQGIITSNEQATHNVEYILQYLNSEIFDRKIQSMIDASIAKAMADLPSENKTENKIIEKNDENKNESAETEGVNFIIIT
jgi:hypothetical protein